jgi:hypothetical protein
LFPLVLPILAGGTSCASRAASAPSEDLVTTRHVDKVTPTPDAMPLAGTRCHPHVCKCRSTDNEVEETPPPPGQKRLEFRMSADGGDATLKSPSLGRLTTAGPQQACFYVDVEAGSKHSFTFHVTAERPERGMGPYLAVTEYGPTGPYWYKTLIVECAGANARCDRAGADAWGRGFATRKRGRLDPCGSMVVTNLNWETSGSEASRDSGFFADFTVTFDLEAKKFATQFAPGSTECVPK